MNDVLVVIPTYNERENVLAMAEAVCASCPSADILFVDDSSPDGTGSLIAELATRNPRIHLLSREKKEGLGRAYIAGFRWALERTYRFICEMDADFSHHPSDVPRLVEGAREADLALGTRYKGGIRVVNWPLSRLLLSMGAAKYVQFITGMPISDPTGGFKCFRREVLETIPLGAIASNGYSFQIEMTHQAWRLGFRIEEVPIVFDERRKGTSKMSASIVREALKMVWKLWIRSGLKRCPGAVHPRSVAAARPAGSIA